MEIGKYIPIFIPTAEIFLRVEKLLLDNNFKWRSYGYNRPRNERLSYVILNINFDNRISSKYILSYSSSPSMNEINSCDVILDNNNVDFFIKNLFIFEPDYRPKQKIDRSL